MGTSIGFGVAVGFAAYVAMGGENYALALALCILGALCAIWLAGRLEL